MDCPKPAVRWVAQEDPYGCGIAAFAMLLGITYQEARRLLPDERPEETGMHVDDVLPDFGFATLVKHQWIHWRIRNNKEERRTPWPPEPFYGVHLCRVQVTATSPVFHWVIMLSDGSVLDPLTPTVRHLTDYEVVASVAAVVPLNPERRFS